MKEISSVDFPQRGEVFYFYGRTLHRFIPVIDDCPRQPRKIRKAIKAIIIENRLMIDKSRAQHDTQRGEHTIMYCMINSTLHYTHAVRC
jgi:hypothetical protein